MDVSAISGATSQHAATVAADVSQGPAWQGAPPGYAGGGPAVAWNFVQQAPYQVPLQFNAGGAPPHPPPLPFGGYSMYSLAPSGGGVYVVPQPASLNNTALDATFMSRGDPRQQPFGASTSSRTAGAALAIALRAAASVALSKNLSQATHPPPTASVPSPATAPAPLLANTVPDPASTSEAHESRLRGSSPESENSGTRLGSAKGTNARPPSDSAASPKQSINARPRSRAPSGTPAAGEIRISAAPGSRQSVAGRMTPSPYPSSNVDAGAANALIAKAVAERYDAESARVGLEAEVGRLRRLLAQQHPSQSLPQHRQGHERHHTGSPQGAMRPRLPPETHPSLSLISFVDEPSLPTAPHFAAPEPVAPAPVSSAPEGPSPAVLSSAPPAPAGVAASPPASSSMQPRARAARLRASMSSGIVPVMPSEERPIAADDTTAALPPRDDVALPSTLREALAASAVFRHAATRGVLGQRRWAAGAASAADAVPSRNHRGVVYPVGPDYAEYFTDLAAAEAQAASDGLEAFVPLRLVSALQREMEVQERLMAALNQDNARLRREVNAAAAPEAGRTGVERPVAAPLGSFAPELGGDGDGAARQGHSGSAVAADLRRELAAAAEVERLRGLLAAAAATSATREAELAAELEAQRRARADLEFRLGGVDVPAMTRDASEARRYEGAIAELHAKHSREVATLETRLAWYRDNQAILDQDRETITSQAAQIRKLQARLGVGAAPDDVAEQSGGVELLDNSGAAAGGDTLAARQQKALLAHQLAVAKRRIIELEKDLAAARDALDRRHPESLSSLIRAAKGSDGAVGEPAQLLAELARVREEAHAAAEAHDRQLRALRQQHELLKAQYAAGGKAGATNLSDAEGVGQKPAPPQQPDGGAASAASAKREAGLKSRIDSLEKELERVRAFYTSRVRELSAQVKDLQAAASVASHTAAPHQQAQPSLPRGRTSAGRAAEGAAVARAGQGRLASTRGVAAAAPGAATPTRATLASSTAAAAKESPGVRPGSTLPASSSVGLARHPSPESAEEGQQAGKVGPHLEPRGASSSQASPSRGGALSESAPQTTAVLTQDENAEGTASDAGALREALEAVQRRVATAESRLHTLAEENAQLRRDSRGTGGTITDTDGSAATVAAVKSNRALLAGDAGHAGTAPPTSDVARLSAAITLLEARAEARELELVRVERAALSAQDGQLDVERARFRDALRVKDEALELCRRELLGMMAALTQQQYA